MPGPVIAAHAKLEEDCGQCHQPTDRTKQTPLCLACHKAVAHDVTSHTGFHGRISNIDKAQCNACHTEHKGRTADIVKFDSLLFDHTSTDFPLTGSHAALECSGCHAPKKAYRDAPHECVACHRNDDAHAGKLGTQCSDCHKTTDWPHARFDHDKTSFPLHDKHREVACVQCHVNGQYRETPKTCVSCHAVDDVHRGSRGTDCAECHHTTGWKSEHFDHLKQTGFGMLGKHARLECRDCHRSGNLHEKLPRTCQGCHQADDAHAGRLGTECNTCHTNETWTSPSFDHRRDAHFALVGKHAALDCHICHTASIKTQRLGTDCASCHKSDDPHRGALGKDCAQCHTAERWLPIQNFDHDLTSFPLIGLHVAVPCARCHDTPDFRKTPQGCNDCHASNDVHKGGLGSSCNSCHSPNGWKLWEFDHAAQTRFPLTGAHGKLTCGSCHVKPATEVKLPTDCSACHKQDDVHLGQFGAQCQRCHSTITFKGGHRN
jgi:hypothetical protein